MLVAIYAVWCSNLGELATANRSPIPTGLVPPREYARRHKRIAPCRLAVLAVVRHEYATESARKALGMVAWHMRYRRGLPANRPRKAVLRKKASDLLIVLAVLADESVRVKCPHVEFVKPRLHRGDIDLAGRIDQVPRRTSKSPGHLSWRHDANIPLRVNYLRPDKQLVRLAVDHPVCVCSAD